MSRWCVVLLLSACGLNVPPSPVQSAAPLPADPPVTLETMDKECDGLLAELASYRDCPFHEEDEKEDVEGWIETANRNLAAGKKANPEPNAQKAIAGACHRAAVSVKAATQRCLVGPRPKS